MRLMILLLCLMASAQPPTAAPTFDDLRSEWYRSVAIAKDAELNAMRANAAAHQAEAAMRKACAGTITGMEQFRPMCEISHE